MLPELYGNAGMQLLGSITHHQNWQCSAQASLAQGALGQFHTAFLCVTLTQPLLAQPEMPPREVTPIRSSIPSPGGRVSSVFGTCRHRILWLQNLKQWLIRTVRGLNCLNSHSHFCWPNCVPNTSLWKNSKLFLSSGGKSIQMWRPKTSCRYPFFGKSSFTHSQKKHREAHMPQTTIQVDNPFLHPETTSSTHSKTKSAIPESFSHEKCNLKISFYLPFLHCALISLANWLQLLYILIFPWLPWFVALSGPSHFVG